VSEACDFIVVGGSSAGEMTTARLSGDPRYRVALIDAGEHPAKLAA
jgi:choline dehydrogenase-like flavoprotein